MLDFLKIWLDYLGSLSKRITSTKKCIRYKRYTRHKDFRRGNHKGENPTNFFRIVRWSKAVIRNVQHLSLSSSDCLSLSCALESVWGVYKWGREPPYLYPFKSLTKYKTRAYISSHMGSTSPSVGEVIEEAYEAPCLMKKPWRNPWTHT